MSDDSSHLPDDTPAVPERSGPTVQQAVDEAAVDSDDGGALRPPDQSHPHTAPVEQVTDDEAMTTGRVDGEPGRAVGPAPDGPDVPPAGAAVAGGAQSDPGARAADRRAGAPPDGQPDDA